MSNRSDVLLTTDALIKNLAQPHAYPHPVNGKVEVLETHISIVFLAGEFAYKIKKPIKTDFLDYSTLMLRRHFCEEEIRLDRRYASDLYIGVIPIGFQNGCLHFGVSENPIEYAVKMHRFPPGSLLSERIESGQLTTTEVHQLAKAVANFHQCAAVADETVSKKWPDYFVRNLHQIILTLHEVLNDHSRPTLKVIHGWTDEWLKEHFEILANRSEGGFLRECHGDLHLQNVVHWGDRLVPFDGIEFNDQLRWIDVLCDAAFMQMDLAFREHLDLSRTFMNSYLEQSGDYESLVLLRPFLIYRSLVRGLVATIRADQSDLASSERDAAKLDAQCHVSLAYRYTRNETPRLWITHGLSGSGKTTLSELVVQRHEAFRLRSDTERKRLFGLSPTERPDENLKSSMYSEASNERTYVRLEALAENILHAGYSVIIDATFLKRHDRERFHQLAIRQGVSFAILNCHSDEHTLRQRVADRIAKNDDASDADLTVLQHQLTVHESLAESERQLVVEVPDIVALADQL